MWIDGVRTGVVEGEGAVVVVVEVVGGLGLGDSLGMFAAAVAGASFFSEVFFTCCMSYHFGNSRRAA